MTIIELITRALEYEPLSETAAQKILLRILSILRRGTPKELPDSKEKAP